MEIITSHVLPLASFTRDIYILDLPLSFGATGCTHKGAFPQGEIKPPLCHLQGWKQLGSKNEKCLNLLKYAWLTGF
jgi:hypothetical protein